MANKYASLSTRYYKTLGDKTYNTIMYGELTDFIYVSSNILCKSNVSPNNIKRIYNALSITSSTTQRIVSDVKLFKSSTVTSQSTITSKPTVSILNSLNIKSNTVVSATNEINKYVASYINSSTKLNISYYSVKYITEPLYLSCKSNVYIKETNILYNSKTINCNALMYNKYTLQMFTKSNIECFVNTNIDCYNIKNVSLNINSKSKVTADCICKINVNSDINCLSYSCNLPLQYNNPISYENLYNIKYYDIKNGLINLINYISDLYLYGSSELIANNNISYYTKSDIYSSSSTTSYCVLTKRVNSLINSKANIYCTGTFINYLDLNIGCNSSIEANCVLVKQSNVNIDSKSNTNITNILLKYIDLDIYNKSNVYSDLILLKQISSNIISKTNVSCDFTITFNKELTIISESNVVSNCYKYIYSDIDLNNKTYLCNLPLKYSNKVPIDILWRFSYRELSEGLIRILRYVNSDINCTSSLTSYYNVSNTINIKSTATLNSSFINILYCNCNVDCNSNVFATCNIGKKITKHKLNVEINKKHKVVVCI